MSTIRITKHQWLSAVVLGSLLTIVFRLRDRDLEFVIEADFNYPLIQAWQKYLTTGDITVLPRPGPHVYLDGQHVLYALATNLIEWLSSFLPAFSAHFPNHDSYAFGAALFLNWLSYSAGCWFFYQTILKLSRCVAIALVAALVVCLSPPMLAIPLVRVDWLIFGPYAAVLYVSVLMALGEQTLRHAILLGAALGLLATIKVSGVMFAAMPFFAIVARVMIHRRPIPGIHFLLVAVAILFAVVATMLHRQLLSLNVTEFIANVGAAFQAVSRWELIYRHNPNTYYFFELFLGHGFAFICLYLVALAYCVYSAACRKDPVSLFLVLNVVLFAGTATYILRYHRGGYHLLPLYVLAAALVISALWRRAGKGYPGSAATAGVLTLAFFSSIPYGIHSYRKAVNDLDESVVVVARTKRAAREWLTQHIPVGATLCLAVDSNWALPLQGLNYKFENGPFRFPYLDEKAMSAFAPPPIDELARTCPVIVFSGFHKDFYLAQSSRASPAMGDAWKNFYSELSSRYSAKIFEAADKKWKDRTVEIYDLRAVASQPAALLSPIQVAQSRKTDSSLLRQSELLR